MIPTWLAPTLGGTHRTARLRTCPHCQAPVLAGLDAERAGTRAVADLTPVNEMGEAIALINGRATFDLIKTGGRMELNWRDSFAIEGVRRYPVIPAHKCGQPLDVFMEAVPAKARYVVPDVCPF